MLMLSPNPCSESSFHWDVATQLLKSTQRFTPPVQTNRHAFLLGLPLWGITCQEQAQPTPQAAAGTHHHVPKRSQGQWCPFLPKALSLLARRAFITGPQTGLCSRCVQVQFQTPFLCLAALPLVRGQWRRKDPALVQGSPLCCSPGGEGGGFPPWAWGWHGKPKAFLPVGEDLPGSRCG